MSRDMSKSWLGMIGCAEREDFAAEEREHGTNERQSTSSQLESLRFVRGTHNRGAVRFDVLAVIQI